MEVKLYVHGVPDGQKKWGVEDFDSYYIETFYSSKAETVAVKMIVEIRQFGSKAYSYYTFLRKGNVLEKKGRTGSYIALTLRFNNSYYADIPNLYNLLNAAYEKFIVGKIVEQNGETIRHLVTDYNQHDAWLKQLEQEIKHYLTQFSSDSDYVSLGGFKTIGSTAPMKVSLLDCGTYNMATYVKNTGAISVSPLYPSRKVQDSLKTMDNRVKEIKEDATRKITEAHHATNAAKAQAETLRVKVGEYKEKIEKLGLEKNSLTLQLREAASYKEKYIEAKQALDKVNPVITKIRDCVSEFNGNKVIEKPEVESQTTDENYGKRMWLKENVRKLFCHFKVFVIILLCLIIFLNLLVLNNNSNTRSVLSAIEKAGIVKLMR